MIFIKKPLDEELKSSARSGGVVKDILLIKR